MTSSLAPRANCPILESVFVKGFIRLADDGFQKGWHERNGGNLTYRIAPDEIKAVAPSFDATEKSEWRAIGTEVPSLAGAYFLVTGSGKYFRNMQDFPHENMGIIEIDAKGEAFRILWGLAGGGLPTSELPTHLVNHAIVKQKTSNLHRVIYHGHPPNAIALTFILPLTDRAFSRELWGMATECPVVFPEGIGIVPWMVPGSGSIAKASSRLMEKYRVVIWAHHGVFCSGRDFDDAFGLMDTVEKSAEISVKVRSMGGAKQGISVANLRHLAKAFQVVLPETFLQEE